jgi:hypothetical protein
MCVGTYVCSLTRTSNRTHGSHERYMHLQSKALAVSSTYICSGIVSPFGVLTLPLGCEMIYVGIGW